MKKIIIDLEELRELYLQKNYTQRQLAEHFGVSVSVINHRLKSNNITKEQITKELLEEKWLNGDYSVEDLATLLNCSRGKIEYHIKKHNLKKSTKIDLYKKQVIELFQQGNTYYRIHKTVGCSLSTVYSILEKENLKNPTKVFNEYDKEQLTKLYIDEDYTLEELSKYFKTSVAKINRYIKHYNIIKKNVYDIDKIKNLYLEQNLKQHQVADILGIKITTLQNILKRNGISKDRSSFPVEKLKKLVQKQLSIQEIADEIGFSRTYTGQIINNLNLDRCFSNKETSIERKIKKILDKYCIKYEQHNRDIIEPKELDFYLYEYDIAIEVCGLYWHSTKINANKYHIQSKYRSCADQGLRLITIFEDEILDKLNIVENRLKTILNLQNTTCYARQCIIKQISAREGIDFLNAHHIQGSGRNSVYLGAFYNDALVAVMSFAKPSIAKGKAKAEWELNRLAIFGNIPGIASKLLTYFIKKYKPESIISYADLRWNTGKVYEMLGFVLSHTTQPNYWYVAGLKRLSRFSYTKHNLCKMLNIETTNNTEEELATKLGLYRIYDCANNVYIWQKSC